MEFCKSIDIISAQLDEAKKLYAQYINPIFHYEFEVKFDQTPNNRFVITLGEDFPQTPPRIRRNNKEFETSMTSNWLPAFTLKHLIQHLQICAQAKPVPPTEFNRKQISDDLQQFPAKIFATPEARSQFLSDTLPITQKAYQEINQVKQRMKSNDAQIKELEASITSQADTIREKAIPNAQFGQLSSESKRSLIEQYKNEAKKIQKDIDEFIRPLSYDDFWKNKEKIMLLYQRKHLLEEAAHALEDRTDIRF